MLNFVRSEPRKVVVKTKASNPEERMEISSYVTSIKVRKAAANALSLTKGDSISYQKTEDGTIYVFKSSDGRGSKVAEGNTFNNAALRREFLKIAGLDPTEIKQHHLVFSVGTPVENPTLIDFDENDKPIYSQTETTRYFPLTFKEEAPLIQRKKKEGEEEEGEDDYTDDIGEDELEQVDGELKPASTKIGFEDL